MSDALIITDRRALVPERVPEETHQQDNSPGAMVRLAIERGLPVDQLQQLLELKREHDRDEARKAFAAGMAEFAKRAPKVIKSKRVSFKSVDYKHAELADFTDATKHLLGECGFEVSWIPEQSDDLKRLTITCEVTHERGHARRATLSCAVNDADKDDRMNGVQRICSAATYLERYTLKAALGLAEHGDDDDGRGRAPQGQPPAGAGNGGRREEPRQEPTVRPATGAQMSELRRLREQLPPAGVTWLDERVTADLSHAAATSLIRLVQARLAKREAEAPAADAPAECDHQWSEEEPGVCTACGTVCHHPKTDREGWCRTCGWRIAGAAVDDPGDYDPEAMADESHPGHPTNYGDS